MLLKYLWIGKLKYPYFIRAATGRQPLLPRAMISVSYGFVIYILIMESLRHDYNEKSLGARSSPHIFLMPFELIRGAISRCPGPSRPGSAANP